MLRSDGAKFEIGCLSEGTSGFYESVRQGQKKIRSSISCPQKNNAVTGFRYGKASNWQKLITSKLRQRVKPGRNSALILQGKLTASPTAKHSIREGSTKRATGFLSFRSLLS
jgi:hypothetical protein